MTLSQEKLIPFAAGIDAQADAVKATYHLMQGWLAAWPVDSLKDRRLLFIGIGASRAVLASTIYQLRAKGVDAQRSDGDDLPDGSPMIADWYIGVSQSGRSPEVVRAIRQQPDRQRRISIVNQPGSPLEQACGIPINLGALIDSGMSSVALMATAVVLGMLSDALTGTDNDAAWQRLPSHLTTLASRLRPQVAHFAARLKHVGCVDLVARAGSLTAAEQGALFLREGPKVPAMASATRNYLHGMTDAVGNTAHVIIGGARESLLARQLAEFAVPILLVTDNQDDHPPGVDVVAIPLLPAGPRTLVEILVMELLALELAAVWGSDIDAGVMGRIDTKLAASERAPGEERL